jgi:hypothetical protein
MLKNIEDKYSPKNQQQRIKSTINLQSHHPIIPSFKFINVNSSKGSTSVPFFNSRVSTHSNKKLEESKVPKLVKSHHETM